MNSNTFGKIFSLTSFGESHGKAIGGIIDGCPAGISIDVNAIQLELDRRKPGQSKIVTQRKEGDKVKGKVSVLADYGAFVEIADGVEGLVHVSEMSWSTHLRSAQDFVSIGDEVDAIILTLDRESRKMSLGIKQISPDPWTDITSKYPIGSKHSGLVRNFTNFGVFIELEEGIDGLVYISDLSWTKKVKHPTEILALGEKILSLIHI